MTYRRAMAFTLSATILLGVQSAAAWTVQPGCAAATAIDQPRKIFYIDPNKGNPSGDGSAAKPWRTLAEVLSRDKGLVRTRARLGVGSTTIASINPSGPIQSGDRLVLMNGNHGDVAVQGMLNTDFISVVAGANQTPIVKSIRLDGISRWYFRGITFQGGPTATAPKGYLAGIDHDSYFGVSDNIIFNRGSFSTAASSSGWTAADWVNRPFENTLKLRGTCMAVTENRFFNVRNGIAIASDKTLIESNTIELFGNDGITFFASDVTIRDNIFRLGRHTSSEPLHADAIQGWSTNGKINRNTLIENNSITQASDPNGQYLQGISIFDGKWDGMKIQNNAIVLNTWNAIVLNGVANATVANNTLVSFEPKVHAIWISIGNAKDGTQSRNVRVANNITPVIRLAGSTVRGDKNMISNTYSTSPDGKTWTDTSAAGTLPGGNVILKTLYQNLAKIDNKAQLYDLRVKEGAIAIINGAMDIAPTSDIDGNTRRRPDYVGSYAR